MEYKGTLISVNDIDKSKEFYSEVLGLEITADFGENVTYDNGVILQTEGSWGNFIGTDNIKYGNNNAELYFEEKDICSFVKHLKKFNIKYVHKLFEHNFGQRVIRFYDPDMHIIEVGEEIVQVVKRFIDSPMTVEQAAKRMDVPESFIIKCLKEIENEKN